MTGTDTPPRASERTVDIAPLACAEIAAVLVVVLQWTNGMYRPFAVVLVAIAWLVAVATVLGSREKPSGARAMKVALGSLFGLSLALMVTEIPTELVSRTRGPLHTFNLLVVVVAFLGGIGITSTKPLVEKYWFPALVAVHVVMASLVLHFAAKPQIDVWSIEMEAVQGLLHGTNPFSMTFEDPYHGTSKYFPPGVSVDGRLQFGFVYPPLALLMCIPGYLLGGDTRWSMLLAIEASALLIGYCRPGPVPKLAAIAFLFMPRTFFVMDRAWTDSFVVLLTAAVCFCALRAPRWLWVPIGLYVCLKQHMFIGIPALFLLMPRPIPWRKVAVLTAKAGAVAAIVTLPFVLVNTHAFMKSVLDIREMYRVDSLGLIALFHNTGIATLSKWCGLIAIVPVTILGFLRAPRTAGGFALLAGVTHFTLYIWSTHAFCNEYYNVIGALFCAIAAWGSYDGERIFHGSDQASLA